MKSNTETIRDLAVRMTREEIAVLSRLLDEALDLAEPRRTAWLANLAEPFSGARAALQQMLEADAAEAIGRDLSFMNTLPKLDVQAAEHPGSRIGVYLLDRPIGEGGMSVVWLARRTDALTDRPVALKLPHLHLSGARLAERLTRERDILAKLSHPHIAHLYDAGVTEHGQPYLVMEYVEGETLLGYCTRQELSVTARVHLFLQILDAVGHAHAKGIIHRDIKPSNMLVRASGVAVLLDFGIAKLLTEGQADMSDLTVRGGALLTLHYASPEQIGGDRLTPYTDIYSLGVVLYELLCHQRPHEMGPKFASRQEFERLIVSTDPLPPSRRLAFGMRAVRGDLDAIVLKALRKNPEERYATCEAFAEDLRAHLRGETVGARAGSRWYWLRRKARRHLSALLTVAAVASIVIGVGTAVRTVLLSHSGTIAIDLSDGRLSIAVLPFDNLGLSSDNDYFAQGIQGEVLSHIANISGLKVMARSATERFRNQPGRIEAVKSALGVANVLEGSVQRQGDRVLVNVELIATADETQLWAESFDRPLADIFAVERDIAEKVAVQLRAKLLPAERHAAATVETSNVEAHTAYLWGRFYMLKHDEGSLRKAIGFFQDAIRRDPAYATAYADLSTVTFNLANFLDESNSASVKDEARAAARKAISLAPDLAEAHAALGWVLLYFDWDVTAAERELSLAVRIAPNSLRARIGLANLYAVFGELDRAVAAMGEAQKLDPLSTIISSNLANYTLGQQRNDAASSWCRKTLEVDRDAPYCHGILAIIALDGGDLRLAEREAALEPDDEWKDFTLTLVRQRVGDVATADSAMKAFIERHSRYSPYLIAAAHAFRGEADAAFEWLDRAYRARDVGTMDFLQSPFFIRYRDDPRYREFARTLGVAR